MKRLGGYVIGILGGDNRERVLMKHLLSEGAILKVLGDPGNGLTSKVNVVYELEQLVKGVDVIIGPMSGTDAEGLLKARYLSQPVYLDDRFFSLVPGEVPVLIGMVNEKVKIAAKKYSINLHLLALREDIAILNAIPTAEGAIQIAMEEVPITIHGSKTLVMGLGKCGLPLAWRLRALGSEVYGVTRSSIAIAKARDLGINTITYNELDNYLPLFDIIFNTVPALVLDEKRIKMLKKDILIIDLASAPGGTDFEAAKKYKIKALLALGLPGKVAPKTSGDILGEVVPEVILEQVKK